MRAHASAGACELPGPPRALVSAALRSVWPWFTILLPSSCKKALLQGGDKDGKDGV